MNRTTKPWKMTVSVIMLLALTLTGCGKSAGKTDSDTVQWFNNTYAVLTVLNERDYRIYSGSRPNIASKTPDNSPIGFPCMKSTVRIRRRPGITAGPCGF